MSDMPLTSKTIGKFYEVLTKELIIEQSGLFLRSKSVGTSAWIFSLIFIMLFLIARLSSEMPPLNK